MLALDVGKLSFWLFVSLVIALAALAVILGIAAALGKKASRRLTTRLAVGVGTLAIVAPLAGVIVYTQFINDPEPKFDENDLADLVSGGDDSASSTTGMLLSLISLDTGSTVESATEPDSSVSDSSDASGDAECAADATESSDAADEAGAEAGEAGEFDGEWVIADGSEVGYRVPEELAGVDTEAVGRGTDVAGSFTVAGNEVTEVCIVAQVATITSDESMRDGQFTGRIMETEEFPTATFVVTEPISFDELPEVGGDAVTVSVTGQLTLHGVTNEVTFDAQVQAGDEGIGVLGEIPILFADYEIEDPSGGPAQVGDEGSLEVLLLFTQA